MFRFFIPADQYITIRASLESLQQALLTLTKEVTAGTGGESTCGCD